MTWAWMFGPTEVILVLVALLLLFGARRVPELARSLGRSLSEFKKGRAEGEKEVSSLSSSDSRQQGRNETAKQGAPSDSDDDKQETKSGS